MFYFNLKEFKYKSIHFIGIGGVSMSGIAGLLHDLGYTVTGSDRTANSYTAHLVHLGIPVVIGQSRDNIADQDLFVYTDAIPETNEELIAARETQKPVVSRGRFLGAIMRNYTSSIAVSGSHGKSTTTSLIANILLHGETDPTILLGASLDEIEGNHRTGESAFFLAEACEYKGNIRYYFPEIAVVLNIDEDHLDYYRNLDDITNAFSHYMANLSEESTAVLNIDDENCRKLLPHIRGKAVTFAVHNDSAMYKAKEITFDELGHPRFTIRMPDASEVRVELNILGAFNVYNALAAFAVTHQEGVSLDRILQGIASFKSLHRRMEVVGEFNGARVLTDYGHHPIEIESTLGALAEHKNGDLICVFQPHTYSRTRSLMDGFAKAFYSADEVVVTDIMGAREVDDGSVHATELVERLIKNGVAATYQPSFDDCETYLATRAAKGDMILTTGCGNIDLLAYQLTKKEPLTA